MDQVSRPVSPVQPDQEKAHQPHQQGQKLGQPHDHTAGHTSQEHPKRRKKIHFFLPFYPSPPEMGHFFIPQYYNRAMPSVRSVPSSGLSVPLCPACLPPL